MGSRFLKLEPNKLINREMESIIGSKLEHTIMCANLNILSEEMDRLEKVELKNVSWPKYQSTAKANFSIAHQSDQITIKFRVTEKHLSVNNAEINGAVNRDNCVEFFVQFPDCEEYYNIEFNCLGVGKIGFGKSRYDRWLLDETLIKSIKIDLRLRYCSSIINNNLNWELLLVIPLEFFCYNKISSFDGMLLKANFYKCGDDLPDSHYLTWNKIETHEPDFHQPNYFGEVQLA